MMKTKDNKINYSNNNVVEGQNIAVNIPHNFFEVTAIKSDIFNDQVFLKRELEQYIFNFGKCVLFL